MSEKSDFHLLADAIMRNNLPAPRPFMMTITVKIMQPGGKIETKTISVERIVSVVGSTAYVPVWSGHVAELDLTRPDLGWTVFPD